MKQILNFAKGSLFGALLLTLVYSPHETGAENFHPVETQQGMVTVDAIIMPTTPVLLASLVENPATPSASVTPTPTVVREPIRIATSSAKTALLAKNTVVSTPTIVSVPTPAPQPVADSSIPYDEHFTKYAAAFNVNKETLVRIARCESGFREGAVNGPYLGMFQYLADTWSSTRNAMGENPDPALRANAEEVIKTSAWKIAHGGIGAWPVCGR